MVLIHTLRLAGLVALLWSATSVALAAYLSAVFRARRRVEARWEEAARRRLWVEATR